MLQSASISFGRRSTSRSMPGGRSEVRLDERRDRAPSACAMSMPITSAPRLSAVVRLRARRCPMRQPATTTVSAVEHPRLPERLARRVRARSAARPSFSRRHPSVRAVDSRPAGDERRSGRRPRPRGRAAGTARREAQCPIPTGTRRRSRRTVLAGKNMTAPRIGPSNVPRPPTSTMKIM